MPYVVHMGGGEGSCTIKIPTFGKKLSPPLKKRYLSLLLLYHITLLLSSLLLDFKYDFNKIISDLDFFYHLTQKFLSDWQIVFTLHVLNKVVF